ncbi:hypothetical protein A2U01_0017569, partial [Trifolium medium]|nr:hypothetical protein [Trifolium medium]
MNLPSSLLPSIDLSCIRGSDAWSFMKNDDSTSSQDQLLNNPSKIWVPNNPRGAERLPPGIVNAQSDFYLRRLWGLPSE